MIQLQIMTVHRGPRWRSGAFLLGVAQITENGTANGTAYRNPYVRNTCSAQQ
jgi:hypothetical protein